MMFCGDMNADPNTKHGHRLLVIKFAGAYNFVMHMDEPTCITYTTATIHDQFITKFPHQIENPEALP